MASNHEEQVVKLSWNNFTQNLRQCVNSMLLMRQDFADITIEAEHKQIKAHRFFLATGSTFFQRFLEDESRGKNDCVYLSGIKYEDIKALLFYMYTGEIVIESSRLPSFLATAAKLGVKGLVEHTDETNDESPTADSTDSNASQSGQTLALDNNSMDASNTANKDGDMETEVDMTEVVQEVAENHDKVKEVSEGDKEFEEEMDIELIDPEPNERRNEQELICLEEDEENAQIVHRSDDISRPPTNQEDITANVPKFSSPSSEEKENARINPSRKTKSSRKKQKTSKEAPKLNVLNERIYPCEICNIDYRSSFGLDYHKRIKHNVGDIFKCDICNKSFGRVANLLQHKEIVHNKEKRFFCDVCLKGFYKEANLKYHNRIHTGEKPFTCELCKKTFSEKSNLNQHMNSRVHLKDRKYSCNHCPSSFVSAEGLQKHTKKFHPL